MPTLGKTMGQFIFPDSLRPKRMVFLLRFFLKFIALSAVILNTVRASSNWDRMSWDWDNWYEPLFTQGDLEAAIEEAEAAKDEVIETKESVIDRLTNVVSELPQGESSLWDTMEWDNDHWFIDVTTLVTEDEVDQIVEESVAQIEGEKDKIIDEKMDEIVDLKEDVEHRNDVIDKLNETIVLLPHGGDSLWDAMEWDNDNWFIDVNTLITPSELEEIVGMSVAEAEDLKDAVINQKELEITNLGDALAAKDGEITALNETIDVLRSAVGSAWDSMVWNEDDWYIQFDALTSVGELLQAISDAEDGVISNGIILVDLSHVIASQEMAADNAVVDKDGDGLTDAEEAALGSDPNSYELSLKAGWNLMSVARIPDDNSSGKIFMGTDVVGTVWIWDDNQFKVATELLPSRGHWVYAKSDENIPIQLPENN